MLVSIIRALMRPARRSYAPRKRRRKSPKYTPTRQRDQAKTSAPANSTAKVASFDPSTAKPQLEKRTLAGRPYIVDGDTITVQRVQIRLFGIDAPEKNHPYGRAAKSALYRMCKGRTVHAQVLEVDDHGRTVAICRLDDGRDLSAEMVKMGLAIDWPKYSGGAYQHLETQDVRKKLWLADARQKGRMYLWYRYDLENGKQSNGQAKPCSRGEAHPKSNTQSSELCPNCGAEMVVRPNRKTGVKFLGCSRFPRCKGSRNLS